LPLTSKSCRGNRALGFTASDFVVVSDKESFPFVITYMITFGGNCNYKIFIMKVYKSSSLTDNRIQPTDQNLSNCVTRRGMSDVHNTRRKIIHDKI